MRIPAIALLAAALSLSCTDMTEAQRGAVSGGARNPGWRTNTAKRSIELGELMSGGPSKDDIPAITHPHFVSVIDARHWLRDNEPVITLEAEGEARLPAADPRLA